MNSKTYTAYVTKLLGYHSAGLISKTHLCRGLRKARRLVENKS